MNLRQAAQQALESMDDHMYRADTHEFYEAKEALLLAEKLEQQFPLGTAQHYLDGEAAAELRRLHAENKRLETLCYDYLGELTALRAAEQMRKQRKPLTDEEIEQLLGAIADTPRAQWLRQAAIEVVRKTEAAHGIGEQK